MLVVDTEQIAIFEIYVWRSGTNEESACRSGRHVPSVWPAVAAVRFRVDPPHFGTIEAITTNKVPGQTRFAGHNCLRLRVRVYKIALLPGDTPERSEARQTRRPPRLTPHLPINLHPRPSPSTAHPDPRDIVKLSVLTSRPLLVGLLLCRGRLALSRPHPASSTEGRRSRQSAPSAAALRIERALLAPVSAGRTRLRPGPALRNFC
jgi:hypothetical protein